MRRRPTTGRGRHRPAFADIRKRLRPVRTARPSRSTSRTARGSATVRERSEHPTEEGAPVEHVRYRTLAGALAVALAVTACGGGGEGDDGAGAASGGPIDLWHIQTDHADLLEDAAARYEADHEGAQVDVTAIENETYKTQIRVALGAGEAPCVFISWGGGPLVEYVAADQVVDLGDRLEQDGYRERFVDVAFDNVSVDDGVYGVPVENTAAAVVWYDQVTFEEQGLTPPTTWDELLTVVDELQAAGIAPFALANSGSWPGSMYYMYLVDRLAGPEVFEAAATRSGGSFEDEVFVEAGRMLQDLVERGAFAEGINGLDWDAGQSRALMYSGDAAMELMGNWNLSIVQTENPDYAAERLGWFPFPAVEGGEGDPSNIVGTIGDNYYHVASTCEDPDAAFEVIQYLIDDESAEAREAIGRIPPLVDFEAEDPVLADLVETINAADSVQLWYDQYLPPELAQVHLETTQALFGLSMTPEEAASRMEAAAVSYFDE
ncbi:extracellular solute-binding protein [Nitriliruptoraceae bacterium ZYF776]|nr:extracellular solute-binding protein [Profundirhabdus halotolerans]